MLIEDKTNKKNKIIPIFISHMGCPNQCVFCDQRSISGTKNPMTPEMVKMHIENILDNDKNFEIAFFGGSFTGIEAKLQEEYLEVAKNFNLPIRISTRPDYIDQNTLNRLKAYGVRTIELGVQSMSDDILKASGRGHTTNQTIQACKLIKSAGFTLGIQTMIGLPLETKKSVISTANAVANLKPDIIRIYPVLVLKGTELEEMMISGSYKPLLLEEAVELSAIALNIYREAQLNVIRVGLQSSDEISTSVDSKIAGGPNHPAFRQFVESLLLAEKLKHHKIDYIISGKSAVHLLTGHNSYGLRKHSKITGEKFPEIIVSADIDANLLKIFNGKIETEIYI